MNLCGTSLPALASGLRFSCFATRSSSSGARALRGVTRGCVPCVDARPRAIAVVGCLLAVRRDRLSRHGRVARPP